MKPATVEGDKKGENKTENQLLLKIKTLFSSQKVESESEESKDKNNKKE